MFSDAGPDIRWVGNEKGVAGSPCWPTVDPGSAEVTELRRALADRIGAKRAARQQQTGKGGRYAHHRIKPL